jgi:obg-like ATPase 1
LVNLSEQDFLNKKNKWLGKIKEWIDNNIAGEIIPYSAEYEKKLFNEYKQFLFTNRS